MVLEKPPLGFTSRSLLSQDERRWPVLIHLVPEVLIVCSETYNPYGVRGEDHHSYRSLGLIYDRK